MNVEKKILNMNEPEVISMVRHAQFMGVYLSDRPAEDGGVKKGQEIRSATLLQSLAGTAIAAVKPQAVEEGRCSLAVGN